MLSDLLLAAASACRARADQRRLDLTPERWPEYQSELRQTLRRLLGPFPPPNALRARVTGTLQRREYRVDRLIFESRPDFPVTANVYVPTDGRPGGSQHPLPGVLLFCGPTVEGKVHPSCQALCQGLLRKGFVVLVHDSVSQGERSMYVDPNSGEETVPRGPEQMALDARRCLLMGESLAGWCTWDGLRALDYLSQMPEVDPGRLAAAGEAGGGTLALYLAAIDERVRVAAAVGSVATLEERFRAGIPPEPRELLVPALAAGLDHWELLALIAPRPVLIANPDDGAFPLAGARATWAALRALYERLLAPERVALVEVPAPRGLSRPLREEIYGWFLRWLESVDGAEAGRAQIGEPEVEIEPEEALYAAARGQVLASLGGETLFHHLCVSLSQQTPTPDDLTRPEVAAGLVGRARDHLRAVAPLPDPVWIERPPVSPGQAVEVRYQPEPGICLSGSLRMAKNTPRRALLWIEGDGRHAAEEKIRAAARLDTVLAVDPRGFADAPAAGGTGPGGAPPHGALPPEALADLAFTVGRPLVAMQLMDVLAAVRLLRELPETRELSLTVRGVGWGGVLALMAAAVDPEIDSVEAEGAPLSYRGWLRAVHPAITPGLLLPGALPECDLPLIAAAVAPRSLVLMSPLDAAGRPATRHLTEVEYELTARLFALFGAEGKFLIDVPRIKGEA